MKWSCGEVGENFYGPVCPARWDCYEAEVASRKGGIIVLIAYHPDSYQDAKSPSEDRNSFIVSFALPDLYPDPAGGGTTCTQLPALLFIKWLLSILLYFSFLKPYEVGNF